MMADQQARACMPYDGVMGSLPDWIPHNFHIKFETSRNRLLDSRKRTHADLLEAIDDVLTVHSKHIDTDAFALYEAHIGGDDKYILVLARIFHAVQLGETEGLALLTDQALAGRVKKGDDYGSHQATIARKPRGKVGDDGETVHQIIGALALSREYSEESAKALWPRFLGELCRLGLDPHEFDHPEGFSKSGCKYEFGQGEKTITFGSFANSLSRARKKSL